MNESFRAKTFCRICYLSHLESTSRNGLEKQSLLLRRDNANAQVMQALEQLSNSEKLLESCGECCCQDSEVYYAFKE